MAWDFALVELGKSAFRVIPLKRNVQSRLDDYLREIRGLRGECTPKLDRIATLSEDGSIERQALKKFAPFFDYDLALWQFEDALERLKLENRNRRREASRRRSRVFRVSRHSRNAPKGFEALQNHLLVEQPGG